jgi:hypothetical protein
VEEDLAWGFVGAALAVKINEAPVLVWKPLHYTTFQVNCVFKGTHNNLDKIEKIDATFVVVLTTCLPRKAFRCATKDREEWSRAIDAWCVLQNKLQLCC